MGANWAKSTRDDRLTALTFGVLGGNLVTAAIFGYFIWMANWRRTLALQGDHDAAVRILLPCYRPIFRFMVGVYLLSAIGIGCSFITRQSVDDQFYVLQFASLTMLTTFSWVPWVLLQPSISYKAFNQTALVIMPWYILCGILWIFMTRYNSNRIIMVVYWIVSGSPALLLGAGMLTGYIKSRVHLHSRSNRVSIDYMFIFSIFYSTLNVIAIPSVRAKDPHKIRLFGTILACFSILWNQLFPWAMYSTLLADTKFWRGLGRHNQGGFQTKISNIDDDDDDNNRGTTNTNVFRPTTMDIRLVTHHLQGVMREIGDLNLDFAFLDLHKKIGVGAHAEVYSGLLKKKKVAVKLFTPEEVSQDVIEEFVREAKLSRSLNHPNVVHFNGICIRPPQIAMVMELCDGGDLKSNLNKNSMYWDPLMKAQACLDATLAVNYFHYKGYIHRDIKAENFFIVGDVKEIDHEWVRANLRSDNNTNTTNNISNGNGKNEVLTNRSSKSVGSKVGRGSLSLGLGALTRTSISVSGNNTTTDRISMHQAPIPLKSPPPIPPSRESTSLFSIFKRETEINVNSSSSSSSSSTNINYTTTNPDGMMYNENDNMSKGFSVKLGDFGESTRQRLNSDGTLDVRHEKLYNTQARGYAGKLDDEEITDNDNTTITDKEIESKKMDIKGTAAFLAPELIAAEKKYTEKVDIYSLGITFLEIFTNEDPWKGKSVFDIYEAVENGRRPEMSTDSIPKKFQDIIESCWAQNPLERPDSEQLAIQIQKYIEVEYTLDMTKQKQESNAQRVHGSLPTKKNNNNNNNADDNNSISSGSGSGTSSTSLATPGSGGGRSSFVQKKKGSSASIGLSNGNGIDGGQLHGIEESIQGRESDASDMTTAVNMDSIKIKATSPMHSDKV